MSTAGESSLLRADQGFSLSSSSHHEQVWGKWHDWAPNKARSTIIFSDALFVRSDMQCFARYLDPAPRQPLRIPPSVQRFMRRGFGVNAQRSGLKRKVRLLNSMTRCALGANIYLSATVESHQRVS